MSMSLLFERPISARLRPVRCALADKSDSPALMVIFPRSRVSLSKEPFTADTLVFSGNLGITTLPPAMSRLPSMSQSLT